jgi:hypothetical protein
MTIKSQIIISDTDIKLTELISTLYNVTLLAFYRAIDQSKTIFSLVNGFMDEYEDESGIDTANSINESYNSSDDYYAPVSGIDTETKLLLHLDNNVTDSATSKSVTNNNVTFSATNKFGSYSGAFNGSSSYLSLADSDDWSLGSTWTIDFWINLSVSLSASNEPCLFAQTTSDGTSSYLASLAQNGALYFYSYSGGVGSAKNFGAMSWSTGQWYHIALVYASGDLKFYCDGSLINTNSFNVVPNMAEPFEIGRDKRGNWKYFNGLIDEFRVSKGVARWTSGFTPPSQAYPIPGDMTLISNTQVADSVPASARIVIFEEDVDSVTLNTDLKAYISRDNGVTYSQVTLANEGYYATSKNILCGLVDISGQPSDTDIKYKIETLNSKNLKIHGTGINWA